MPCIDPASCGACFGLGGSRTRIASETPSPAAKPKVVYHLNDVETVDFVLGNIQNHLDGVGELRILPSPW